MMLVCLPPLRLFSLMVGTREVVALVGLVVGCGVVGCGVVGSGPLVPSHVTPIPTVVNKQSYIRTQAQFTQY